MKTLLAVLSFGALAFASGADTPKVPRAKIVNMETLISTQLASMYPEEPYFVIGAARGMYLDGVGVVFSVEINLAMGPSQNPFSAAISKEAIARHRARKEERLPALKTKMFSVVTNMSNYFETLPANEEFILSVTLLRYPWEETAGQPSQIIMRVPRVKLVDAQRASAKSDKFIRVQEY